MRAMKKGRVRIPASDDQPRSAEIIPRAYSPLSLSPSESIARIGRTTPSPAADEPGAAEGPLAAQEYLGPAQVTSIEEGRILVELPGGRVVAAQMALAVPYEPVPEDTLLVIGRGDHHYVIGVLHGSGRTVLSLPGDVEVHASGGSLSLSGDRGVQIRGPELDVDTSKVRMVAETVVQTFSSMYQRVSGLFSAHAHESHTVVDKTSFTRAKNATILTEETVTVNGKQILLG